MKTKRRFLIQFSLRSFFVVMLLVAAGIAWIGEDVIRSRAERRVAVKIQATGGRVVYDHSTINGRIRTDLEPKYPGSRIARLLFGDDVSAVVTSAHWLGESADSDVVELHKLTELTAISLRGPKTTDKCVEDLIRIRKLNGLSLADVSISPTGFAELAACENIDFLAISGNWFSDAHATKLIEFPNLKWIQLLDCDITDEGMGSIAKMDSLLQVDLFRLPKISDDGILKLNRLANLKHRQIKGVAMSDVSMPVVSQMKALKSLRLSNNAITGVGFQHLHDLKQLAFLELNGTQIGDGTLAIVAGFSDMEYLNVGGTLVTDEGMTYLKSLSKLEHLDINQTSVTDVGLMELRSLDSLTSLDVEIGDQISFDDVDELKKYLPECEIGCWENGGSVCYERR